MLKTVKTRGLALLATVALLGGTAWIAAGTTGAYFSDTQSGAISGTLGTVKVQVNDANGHPFNQINFTDPLMPGTPGVVTIKYTNTGTNAEDIYLNFNNLTALSALNNLGSYGELHITNTDAGNTVTHVFDSANLSDNAISCGGFQQALPGCWPLPAELQVAAKVPHGASGWITFAFNYAGKLKNGSQGTVFNKYPVSNTTYAASGSTDDQVYVNSTDGKSSGLPFQVVATQPNIKPGV